MAELYANDFVTTLAAPVGPSDATVTLTDAPPAPLNGAGQWRLRVDAEILLVTSVSGAVCSVSRAVEPVAGVQAAASHAAGAAAECVLTAASVQQAGGVPVADEAPAGATNGANTTFTLANTPRVGTLFLFLNGLKQRAGGGNDYTAAGANITYNYAPQTGDSLTANYSY